MIIFSFINKTALSQLLVFSSQLSLVLLLCLSFFDREETQNSLQTASCSWSLEPETGDDGLHAVFASLRTNVNQVQPALCDRLVGLVVTRRPRERKIPGSNPLATGFFRGRFVPVTLKKKNWHSSGYPARRLAV